MTTVATASLAASGASLPVGLPGSRCGTGILKTVEFVTNFDLTEHRRSGLLTSGERTGDSPPRYESIRKCRTFTGHHPRLTTDAADPLTSRPANFDGVFDGKNVHGDRHRQ